MYYKLSNIIALRSWKYVDHALYFERHESAINVSEQDFNMLLLCDGEHDITPNEVTEKLLRKGYISETFKGDKISEWSRYKKYDNFYFPKMNLMITGKCNMNCLHCFNAKDNAPLNTEWKYENLLHLLDEAKDVGIHAFTLTGGEPLVHPHFLDIVKAIYERDMYVFELNTNGVLITQDLLIELLKLGCKPLIKISFDGVGFHNWMRQNPKAEDKTIEAIKLCIKFGFDVKVQTQVNLKNYDVMMPTAELLDSLGVKEMRIIRTTEAPRWEKNSPHSSISIKDYYDKMLIFAKQYIDSNLKMNVDIWQFLKIYPKSHSYSLTPVSCDKDHFHIRIPMCRGNRGMVAISSSGEVVPCMQMSGYFIEKGISLANVHQTPLKEILSKSDYLNYSLVTLFRMIINNDKCANCKYFKACTGGCPALGLLYSNKDFDYFHEDITKCYFFENGYYEKVKEELSSYKLLNPLDI